MAGSIIEQPAVTIDLSHDRPVSYDIPAGSQSGTDWKFKNANTTTNLRSAWFDDDIWVVVGDDGYIITSIDHGDTWQQQTSGLTALLRTVKKWNGNWYIVGWGKTDGIAAVLKSADAVTWASIDIGGADSSLVDIAFNDTTMVFVGWDDDTGGAITVDTTDGASFTRRTVSGMDFAYGIVWNDDDNLWGMVGSVTGTDEWFGTSANAIAWTKKNVNSEGELWIIDYDGVNWLVSANRVQIYTSPDSDAWTNRKEKQMFDDNPWRFTHNENNVSMLCGGFNEGKIMRSVDNGENWNLVYRNPNASLMSKAIYGPGYWLAIGWNGTIIKSSN